MVNSIINGEDIIKMARHAVINLDDAEAEYAVNMALEAGIDPIDLIEKGFVEGMKEMGDLFEAGNISILQVLAASKTLTTGINVLKPRLSAVNQDICFFGNIAVNA